jgi:hypothetical protein
MNTWLKLPPVRDHPACLNCGPWPDDLPHTAVLAVGFGMVTVTRDGEHIWSGDDETVTLERFERKARRDANHDWRVEFMGPLNEREYQRQRGHWRLVRTGLGFA